MRRERSSVERLARALATDGRAKIEFEELSDEQDRELEARCRELGLFLWRGRLDDIALWCEAERPGLDPTTGCSNWAAWCLALEQHALTQPLSVVQVDVDRLTRINHRAGIQAADAVVRAVGAAIRSELREGEQCFRRAGYDSFDIILAGVEEPWARERAAAFEAAVDNVKPYGKARVRYRGASVASTTRDGLEPLQKTLNRLGHAMWQAKKRRRRAWWQGMERRAALRGLLQGRNPPGV